MMVSPLGNGLHLPPYYYASLLSQAKASIKRSAAVANNDDVSEEDAARDIKVKAVRRSPLGRDTAAFRLRKRDSAAFRLRKRDTAAFRLRKRDSAAFRLRKRDTAAFRLRRQSGPGGSNLTPVCNKVTD